MQFIAISKKYSIFIKLRKFALYVSVLILSCIRKKLQMESQADIRNPLRYLLITE